MNAHAHTIQAHRINLVGADRMTPAEARYSRTLIALDERTLDTLIASRRHCATREAADQVEADIKAVTRRVAVRQFDLDLALALGA